MALVDKDDMIKLRTAAESRETAQTAEHDIQIKAVAYAINNAANCGQNSIIFQELLRKDVASELNSKGYHLEYVPETDRGVLISWKESANS